MKPKTFLWIWGVGLLVVSTLLLGACGGPLPFFATPTPTATATATSTPTATPTPTPTPIPLAARVNGEPITLAEFDANFAQYQAAAGTDLATTVDVRQRVLDDLIEQAILAQAAAQEGFVLDDATYQARLGQLADELGGQPALETAYMALGYTADSFERSLKRSIAAAWKRDRISELVPQRAEQAHARQILLYNSEEANAVLAQLQAGADFTTLAALYDLTMAGELDWFPRDYLLEPAIEEAVFQLEPGQFSSVIQTRLGFHIIQLIELDPDRQLSTDMRRVLKEKALRLWIEEQRQQCEIEILLP